MHRPSNIDSIVGQKKILELSRQMALIAPTIFPIHPRTEASFRQSGLFSALSAVPNLFLLPPQGYPEMLDLLEHATAVVTDSGGLQEETTYFGTPCLTFRRNTERPCTISIGSNILLSSLSTKKAVKLLLTAINGNWKKCTVPPFWDGHSAKRIAAIVLSP